MVFTEAEINKASNQLLAYQRKNRRTLLKYDQEMRNKEINLVKDEPVCAQKVLEILRDSLDNINAKELVNIVQTYPNETNVMDVMKCTTQATMYLGPDNGGPDKYAKMIRKHISGLNRIGEKSVYGAVFDASLHDAKHAYAIKSPNPGTPDDLLHEMVVGMYGTNRLRHKCLNFAYVYGGFRCPPPHIVDDKVPKLCDLDGTLVNYVIYENLLGSMSSGKYAVTLDKYLRTLAQVAYALRLAHNRIDFTHYDLHTGNVLIRNIGLSSIEYETERGIEYINTDTTPVIIDYGASHIKYNNEDYGVNKLSLSTFADRSNIMHDVYKFFMFLTLNNQDNPDIMQVARKIFTYFDITDTLESALKFTPKIRGKTDVYHAQISITEHQFDLHRFSLPIIASTRDLSIDGFMTHVRSVVDLKFITDAPEYPVLTDTNSLSEDNVYNIIGVTTPMQSVLPPTPTPPKVNGTAPMQSVTTSPHSVLPPTPTPPKVNGTAPMQSVTTSPHSVLSPTPTAPMQSVTTSARSVIPPTPTAPMQSVTTSPHSVLSPTPTAPIHSVTTDIVSIDKLIKASNTNNVRKIIESLLDVDSEINRAHTMLDQIKSTIERHRFSYVSSFKLQDLRSLPYLNGFKSMYAAVGNVKYRSRILDNMLKAFSNVARDHVITKDQLARIKSIASEFTDMNQTVIAIIRDIPSANKEAIVEIGIENFLDTPYDWYLNIVSDNV